MQTSYELLDHVTILDVIPEAKYKDSNAKVLRLQRTECITQFRVGILHVVEYIMIRTSRDQVLEVGRSNPKLRMKDFEIHKSETISTLYGTFSEKH